VSHLPSSASTSCGPEHSLSFCLPVGRSIARRCHQGLGRQGFTVQPRAANTRALPVEAGKSSLPTAEHATPLECHCRTWIDKARELRGLLRPSQSWEPHGTRCTEQRTQPQRSPSAATRASRGARYALTLSLASRPPATACWPIGPQCVCQESDRSAHRRCASAHREFADGDCLLVLLREQRPERLLDEHRGPFTRLPRRHHRLQGACSERDAE
jgi:hypothetical protein